MKERIKRAFVALVGTAGGDPEATHTERAAKVTTKLDMIDRQLSDAQTQIAFLFTEIERLNGLYEAAILRQAPGSWTAPG